MLLGTTSLPYSFQKYMMDKMVLIKEDAIHRPDKIVSLQYRQDFIIEAMCNEINNVSPLSFIAGTEYLLPSRLYMKHFLEA